MELVPILSTIILVGTIATFILAVAAYILYKIRERRARDESRPAGYTQPEPHVLVAPQVAGSLQMQPPAEANVYQSAPAAAAIPAQYQPRQPQVYFQSVRSVCRPVVAGAGCGSLGWRAFCKTDAYLCRAGKKAIREYLPDSH